MTMRAALYRFLVSLAVLLGLPFEAHAVSSVDQCAAQYGSFMPWDFTLKIVVCIEGSIQDAVIYMMMALSDYMASTVGAAFALAVAIFGMRLLGGEKDLKAKGVGFLIRLGVVAGFSYGLGGWAGYIFGMFHELIAWACGGWSPWEQIDYYLGQLLGFGQGNITLINGMLGLIGAAAMASSIGATMSFTALMAIINFLLFMLDIVYAYLSSVIVIGFMIVISPLVIPLGVFYYTERYVKKWIDVTVSAMLMPTLMFGFLYMSLSIFSILIADVFEVLGAPCANKMDLSTCPMRNLSGFWRSNQPAFSWLVPGDPNIADKMTQFAANTGDIPNLKAKTVPPVQTVINPFLNRGFNTNTFNGHAINFGADNIYIMQRLTFAFIALWLFAHIMKAMMTKIPEIAASIAAVAVQIPFGSGSIQHRIREATGNMKVGAGAVGGGIIGGEAGAAVGRAAGVRSGIAREIGGVAGAIGGAFFGAKK